VAALTLPGVLRLAKPPLRRLRGGAVPWFVTWELTERCNQRCAHCGYWRDPGPETSAQQAERIARELVATGVLGVSLCGGEVLLRDDLGALISILARGGLLTRLTTNGRLVPERIEELAELDAVKFSLDGPRGVHDRLRGDGSFDAVMAGIEAVRRTGLHAQVNTLLSGPLLEHLEEHLRQVRRLGLSVTFQPPEVRHPEAEAAVLALQPDPAAFRAALADLQQRKRSGDDRIGNSSGVLAAMERWPDAQETTCQAGRWFARILSDGRIVACDRSHASLAYVPVDRGTLPRPTRCDGCWQNNTLELNRALGGSVDSLRAALRWLRPS